uniref:Uncharacterized protein n=1 Tax=Opuntia streptacantha TaxID=393608 RepID=A0A7C9A9T0_OPUST
MLNVVAVDIQEAYQIGYYSSQTLMLLRMRIAAFPALFFTNRLSSPAPNLVQNFGERNEKLSLVVFGQSNQLWIGELGDGVVDYAAEARKYFIATTGIGHR